MAGGQQVRRERETQTITSSVSPTAMRRVVRAHIRSPLVGLLWMFGLRQEDMMVGVILGDHLYARPVARDSASGNTSRFLVLRGKIVPRGNGGCDLRVSIYPARVFRSLWRLWSGFGLVFGLAGYLASGDA